MQECCEFLLAGYVNLSPKHTHTHTQAKWWGGEWTAWQIRTACMGVASHFKSRLLKWWRWQMGKTDCEIWAQERRIFHKGNKISIQLMVSGLERTWKINYSNIFISKIREKDEVKWLLQSYTEEKGLKFRSLALRDFPLLIHLAPPNLNMKQAQLCCKIGFCSRWD